MLTFPSRSGLFCLECDASNFATGAILSQQQEDGLFHPIGFMSKSFSNTEQNYQIHDKEMLAIMQALEEWRHFLEGSDQKFEIHMEPGMMVPVPLQVRLHPDPQARKADG